MTTLTFADALTFDAPKRTSDGYLAVRALAARTGIYDYRADEVDAPRDKFKATDTVKVYRDPAEVFAEDSMRSFIGRPITDDHPNTAVTRDNWKRHARGTVMAAGRKQAKDGDFLAFDLVLMDGATIDKVEAGKRELSNGYNCELDWTPGETADGMAYDARQVNIRGNHVAIVDKGRAGDKCRIGDAVRSSWPETEANPQLVADLKHAKEARVKLTNLDGLTVNLDDKTAVEQALTLIDNKCSTAIAAADAAKAALDEAKGAQTALETQLADAKKGLEPAALDQLVADRQVVRDMALTIDKDLDTKGLTDAEIRRKAVAARLGDEAKDMSDGEIAGAFKLLAKDVKTTDRDQPRRPQVLDSIRQPQAFHDTAAVRDAIRDSRYN